MNRDKIHFQLRKMDSYNKPFNVIISEREAGKSTAVFWKIYKGWKHKHRPSIILRRQVVDITEVYIDDIEKNINEWLPDSQKIKFKYKKGAIKDGIIDITVNDVPFCRVIALSVPKSRIKSLVYDDVYMMVMDEFIVDNANGEKYLTDEAGKFKECYNTFLRCATKHNHTMRCYWMGNPYSVYSPILVWLGVDLTKLKPGSFIVGKAYIVECYKITKELKDFILAHNPIYEFDDAYTRYAFNGEAINDARFTILPKQPEGYKLRYIFRLSNKYLNVYYKAMNRSDRYGTDYGKYWIDISDYKGSKNIYAIDFNNLISGTTLLTSDIKIITYRLKQCIAQRDVTYSSLESAYLTEAIYSNI